MGGGLGAEGRSGPPADRGKAVGTVQSAWAVGWAAAAIIATVIFQLFPQEIAWRYLFFVGILPAFLVFYIRSKVHEPAIFKAAAEKAARPSPLAIFRRELLATTILGSVLSTGAQGGYYAIHDLPADIPADGAPPHGARSALISRSSSSARGAAISPAPIGAT